jgi:hypothetical protein
MRMTVLKVVAKRIIPDAHGGVTLVLECEGGPGDPGERRALTVGGGVFCAATVGGELVVPARVWGGGAGVPVLAKKENP